MTWVDFDGNCHHWMFDPSLGEGGVYVYHRQMPSELVVKRYILADADIEPWWPQHVKDAVTSIKGPTFKDVLAMRQDERQFALHALELATGSPRESLECFYKDEFEAASNLGLNIIDELGMFHSCMRKRPRNE